MVIEIFLSVQLQYVLISAYSNEINSDEINKNSSWVDLLSYLFFSDGYSRSFVLKASQKVVGMVTQVFLFKCVSQPQPSYTPALKTK